MPNVSDQTTRESPSDSHKQTVHAEQEDINPHKDELEQNQQNDSNGENLIASLTCIDIYFKCDSPVFQGCQCLLGFIEIIIPGIGLLFCPCYGCKRPDCCAVCCAGIWQFLTAPLIIGIVSSCCIGWKMMLCC